MITDIAPARTQPQQWNRALCARMADGQRVWFSPLPSDQREAREACWRCPLLTPCLTYALRTRPEYGVWGGTTPEDRDHLLPHMREEVGSHGNQDTDEQEKQMATTG